MCLCVKPFPRLGFSLTAFSPVFVPPPGGLCSFLTPVTVSIGTAVKTLSDGMRSAAPPSHRATCTLTVDATLQSVPQCHGMALAEAFAAKSRRPDRKTPSQFRLHKNVVLSVESVFAATSQEKPALPAVGVRRSSRWEEKRRRPPRPRRLCNMKQMEEVWALPSPESEATAH